jgi:outer membrane receptor protein involved in Fe transport
LGLALACFAAGSAAAQERTYDFDIPQESLSKALRDFGLATHQQLMFTEALTAGRMAPAIRGVLGAEAALTQILAGSGLAAQRTPTGALIIQRSQEIPESQRGSPPASGAAGNAVQEVLVTASRVERTGFIAPTPTTVISSKVMEQQGITNMASLLVQVPSARANLPGGSLSTFGVFVNLRNLGANRTLVLVDGDRVVPTTAIGTVDLDLIPTIAVDRADVVTGGASAAYGSDAVAGVVNLLLKSRFNGLRVDVQTGQSEYEDSHETRGAMIAGARVLGGRGHVLLAADYDHNTGIGAIYSRPWSRRDVGAITGANGKVIIAENYQSNTMTYGGIIVGGPLAFTAFAPGGVPFQLQLGDTFGNPRSNLMSGGGNYPVTIFEVSPISQPREHVSVLARADYDISAEVRASITLNYANSHSHHDSVYNRGVFNIPIDNPYLPSSIKTQMIANGLSRITVGSAGSNTPFYEVDAKNTTYRAVADASGPFLGEWRWDAHYTHGQNVFRSATQNDVIKARQVLAVDAVLNPATGQIVCRSTISNPSNGCIPLNIFGLGSGSGAAAGYITGTSALRQETSQDDAAVNLRGDIFSTWAGPISVAMGYEYRKDSISATSDPISQVNGFDVYNPKQISGAIKVNEGYIEAVVPLLADLRLAKSLDFDGAVRMAHYSTSGTATTWKAGLVYQVTDSIRIRASSSRDIRAPNLADEFTAGQIATVVVSYGGQSQSVNLLTSGNTRLEPESAKTKSIGIVYTPSWWSGLSVSMDYYDISISKAITALSQQLIINRCAAGVSSFCDLLTIDASGALKQVNGSPVNLNKVRTSGVDINVNYRLDLSSIHDSLPGQLELNALGTYIRHITTVDVSGSVDRAGEIGGGVLLPGLDGPRWVWDGNAHYTLGQLGLNAHVRYISSGVLDVTATPQTLNINDVASRAYLNLAADYVLSPDFGVQIYGGVNNVFNTAPPRSLTNQSIGVSSSYYDVVGRYFYVGARVSF